MFVNNHPDDFVMQPQQQSYPYNNPVAPNSDAMYIQEVNNYFKSLDSLGPQYFAASNIQKQRIQEIGNLKYFLSYRSIDWEYITQQITFEMYKQKRGNIVSTNTQKVESLEIENKPNNQVRVHNNTRRKTNNTDCDCDICDCIEDLWDCDCNGPNDTTICCCFDDLDQNDICDCCECECGITHFIILIIFVIVFLPLFILISPCLIALCIFLKNRSNAKKNNLSNPVPSPIM